MCVGKIYTRACSSSSAGNLVSGRGPQIAPLSDEQLLEEFERHSHLDNRTPTALVSVSSRIIDTIKRAYELFHNRRDNPDEIWIIFIDVPNSCDVRLHSAQSLAEKLLDPKHGRFRYEFLVEGQIPTEWVLHRVSLKTLMSRGLDWTRYLSRGNIRTEEIRFEMVDRLTSSDAVDIGMSLGCFAQFFGARAPLDWIAHQLYYDCFRPKIIIDDMVILKIYNHDDERAEIWNCHVDFEFFSRLDIGIETALFDWWLTDDEFLAAQKEFEEWEADEINNLWEELESLPDDPDVYERAYEVLWSRHSRMVEEQAVRIGL